MNREHGLQTWQTSQRPDASTRALLPILIQVPALSGTVRGQVRKTIHARSRAEVRRPRRRLRREFRLAGYGILLLATLVIGSPLLRGGGPTLALKFDSMGTSLGRDRAAYASAPPPSISISIEPAVMAPYAGAGSPVVFPGYLLPDDSCEEPAHAGS